jgi:hypothetical protein
MTIEERIVAKFIEKLAADEAIPHETALLIEALWKECKLKNVDAILSAIKQGANAHA